MDIVIRIQDTVLGLLVSVGTAGSPQSLLESNVSDLCVSLIEDHVISALSTIAGSEHSTVYDYREEPSITDILQNDKDAIDYDELMKRLNDVSKDSPTSPTPDDTPHH